MIRTRRHTFVPVPSLSDELGELIAALMPWGKSKPVSRVVDTPRGKYSGYSGIHGCLKPYDAMTKAEHEACARFFGGHLED